MALEYFSTGVLEGIPRDVIRRHWTDMPRGDIPIWEMTLPRGWKNDSWLGPPIVPGDKFLHVLQAVLPEFPDWDAAKVAQLDDYLKHNLHPFAHGSAGALSLMLTGTSLANPTMGIVFDSGHPELYSAMAYEVVQFGAMCRHILNCATEYLQSA